MSLFASPARSVSSVSSGATSPDLSPRATAAAPIRRLPAGVFSNPPPPRSAARPAFLGGGALSASASVAPLSPLPAARFDQWAASSAAAATAVGTPTAAAAAVFSEYDGAGRDSSDLLRDLPASSTEESLRTRLSALRERLEASECTTQAYAEQLHRRADEMEVLAEENRRQYLQLKDAQQHIEFLQRLRLLSPEERARQPGERSYAGEITGEHDLGSLRGRALEQKTLEVEQLEEQIAHSRYQVHRLTSQLQGSELEKESMTSATRNELERLRTEMSRLEVDQRGRTRRLNEASGNEQELQHQIEELKRQLAARTQELAATKKEVLEVSNRLSVTELSLQESEKTKNDWEAQYNELADEYEKLREEWAAYQHEVESQQSASDSAPGSLDRLREQLEGEMAHMRQEHDAERQHLLTELNAYQEKLRFLTAHHPDGEAAWQEQQHADEPPTREASAANTPSRGKAASAAASNPATPARYQVHNNSERELFPSPSRTRPQTSGAASGHHQLMDEDATRGFIQSLEEQIMQLKIDNAELLEWCQRQQEYQQQQEQEQEQQEYQQQQQQQQPLQEQDENSDDSSVATSPVIAAASSSLAPAEARELTRSNFASSLPAIRKNSPFFLSEALSANDGACAHPDHATLLDQLSALHAELSDARGSAAALESCRVELAAAHQLTSQLRNQLDATAAAHATAAAAQATVHSHDTTQQLQSQRATIALLEADNEQLTRAQHALDEEVAQIKAAADETRLRYDELNQDYEQLREEEKRLRRQLEGRHFTSEEEVLMPARRRRLSDDSLDPTHPANQSSVGATSPTPIEWTTDDRAKQQFADQLGSISQSGKLLSTISESNSKLTAEATESRKQVFQLESQLRESQARLRELDGEWKEEQHALLQRADQRAQELNSQLADQQEEHEAHIAGVSAKVELLATAKDRLQADVTRHERRVGELERQLARTQLIADDATKRMAEMREHQAQKERARILQQELLEFLVRKKTSAERTQLQTAISNLESEVARLKKEAADSAAAAQREIANAKRLVVHPVASSLSVYVKSLAPGLAADQLASSDHLAIKVLDLLREKLVLKIEAAAGLKQRTEIDDMRSLGIGFNDLAHSKKNVDVRAMADHAWSTLEKTLLHCWEMLLFQQFQTSDFAQEKLWIFLRHEVRKRARHIGVSGDDDTEDEEDQPQVRRRASKSATAFKPLARRDKSAQRAPSVSDSSFDQDANEAEHSEAAESDVEYDAHHDGQVAATMRSLQQQSQEADDRVLALTGEMDHLRSSLDALEADAIAWQQREADMQAELERLQLAVHRNAATTATAAVGPPPASSRAVTLLQEQLTQELARVTRAQDSLALSEAARLTAHEQIAHLQSEVTHLTQELQDATSAMEALRAASAGRSPSPSPPRGISLAQSQPAVKSDQASRAQQSLAASELGQASLRHQVDDLESELHQMARNLQEANQVIITMRQSASRTGSDASTRATRDTSCADPSHADLVGQLSTLRSELSLARSSASALDSCRLELTAAQQLISQLRNQLDAAAAMRATAVAGQATLHSHDAQQLEAQRKRVAQLEVENSRLQGTLTRKIEQSEARHDELSQQYDELRQSEKHLTRQLLQSQSRPSSSPPAIVPFPTVADIDECMMRRPLSPPPAKREQVTSSPTSSALTLATTTGHVTHHHHHILGGGAPPLGSFGVQVRDMLASDSGSRAELARQTASSQPQQQQQQRDLMTRLYTALERGNGHVTNESMHALSVAALRTGPSVAPAHRVSAQPPGSEKISAAFDDAFRALNSPSQKLKGAAAFAARHASPPAPVAAPSTSVARPSSSLWSDLQRVSSPVPGRAVTSAVTSAGDGEFVSFPFFPRGPLMAPSGHVSADPSRFSQRHAQEISLGKRGAHESSVVSAAAGTAAQRRKEHRRAEEANAIRIGIGPTTTPTKPRKGAQTPTKPKPYSFVPHSIVRPAGRALQRSNTHK